MTSEHPPGVSAGHGSSAPDACSVGFDRLGLSAYGTAARAVFWLAVEQTGPWGRDAATQSHLPEGVGAQLDEACAGRGGRLALLRAPGRHADAHHPTGRTAYLAFSGPDPWLLVARDAALEDLLAVDLDALAAGDRTAVLASLPAAVPAEPVLLVCTNGRRDVCCALRGRPVALEAAAAAPGRVWESSHTGGHRFAPTGVLLPSGTTLARLDAGLCAALLAASSEGRLPGAALGPAHDRGRSALPPEAQAAESFVRHQLGESSLAALTARPEGPPAGGGEGVVRVTHEDGRQWQVAARLEASEGPALPESCGKAAIATREWHLRLV